MDIRNLRQLAAVARHGSFTKAADHLGITQASLSQAIGRFEDELGLRLFSRTAAGAALTPVGRALLDGADPLLRDMADLAREVELAAQGDRGVVRIGVGTALRDTLAPALLTRILQAHPQMRLHIDVADGELLQARLIDADLDLVLMGEHPGARHPDFTSFHLFNSRFIACASPAHPLAGERAIPPERLLEFRCAGGVAPPFRNDAIYDLQGVGGLLAVMTNEHALIPAAVEAGLIVTCVEFVGQAHVAAGRAVALDIDWSSPLPFVALARRAVSSLPAVKAVVAHAQEIGATIEAQADRTRTALSAADGPS